MADHMTEIVAHRSGNDADSARMAAEAGHIVEMDAHVLYGLVELRHEKVLRPTRRLWERWYLLPRGSRGVPIDEVLAAVDIDTTIMLDLKCYTRRAARRIVGAVPESHPLIVSTRSWWVLSTVTDRPNTRRLRSCGNRLQLAVATWLARRGSDLGLSVHERLVEPGSLDAFAPSGNVFSWAATTSERCSELVALGATGLILDDTGLLDDTDLAQPL